jgi:AbiA family abortive infection protein
MNYYPSQIGYFLKYEFWRDSKILLDFQTDQFVKSNSFKTLSMFYYRILQKDHSIGTEEYFNKFIASNMFFGLTDLYKIVNYLVPKKILGYRNYKFMTYPMRLLYYSIGIYILKVSSDFLLNFISKNVKIKSFYGGDLKYSNGKLVVNNNTITYYEHYKEFCSKVLQSIDRYDEETSIVLHFDYQNYYDNISIERLLKNLDKLIEPSIKQELNFNESTIEQIVFFFKYINAGGNGIPQYENDIISNYLGYLFGLFGDLHIDDLLLKNKIIKEYSIIRYVDDTYIFINFEKTIGKERINKFLNKILLSLVYKLHSALNLRINYHKSRIFWLKNDIDKMDLRSQLKSTSQDFVLERSIIKKGESKEAIIRSIFSMLEKIKYFEYTKEFEYKYEFGGTINSIYDISINNLLSKKENIEKLEEIFTDFDFDKIAQFPKQLLILILKSPKTKEKFEIYLRKKKVESPVDANIVVEYFAQTSFRKREILKKVSELDGYSEIYNLIKDDKRFFKNTGYFNLDIKTIQKVPLKINYLEQIRLRVYSEKIEYYSAALNHLLNELHAICFNLDPESSKIKYYNYENVQKFLEKFRIENEIKIQIRNLFNRRNTSPLSHPGGETDHYLLINKNEYLEFKDKVGKCINEIVLNRNNP